MKLLETIVPRVSAQFTGVDRTDPGTSDFSIDDFLFLSPPKDLGFGNLVGTIIGWFLTIAALVAFIYLLVAGFQYITAGGDAAKAQAARTGIVNALIGIIVILVAYVVLRYVGGSILSA